MSVIRKIFLPHEVLKHNKPLECSIFCPLRGPRSSATEYNRITLCKAVWSLILVVDGGHLGAHCEAELGSVGIQAWYSDEYVL